MASEDEMNDNDEEADNFSDKKGEEDEMVQDEEAKGTRKTKKRLSA